jgi:hypothetical protein
MKFKLEMCIPIGISVGFGGVNWYQIQGKFIVRLQ